LHFNRCLTTEYSETTAYFNGNFDDNQIYDLRTVAKVHSDFPDALYYRLFLPVVLPIKFTPERATKAQRVV
jgi:hypothetical protein